MMCEKAATIFDVNDVLRQKKVHLAHVNSRRSIVVSGHTAMLGRRAGAARALALAACALLLAAATAADAADAPPETGEPVDGSPGETDRDPRAPETRKQQRARRPAFVDDCDACAAAGYAVHDALAYQQARMRAKLGGDARLAEVTDRAEYAAAAVESACGARGHWLRYAMRGVLDPETDSPFLVLSGPGMDSDGAPGLTRPDDRRGTVELSEALRARCVEETARVGEAFLLAAFDDVDKDVSDAADINIVNDAESRTAENSNSRNKEEHAATFAYALCVDAARAKKAGAPKPPCAETTVRRRAGAVIAAAAREAETVRSLNSAVFVSEGDDDPSEEEDDENDVDPLSALLEQCADRRAELEEVTRAAARGAASGLDPDVGLGADAAFARRCLTASSAAAARGDAFARAASAALKTLNPSGSLGGAHTGDGAEGSPETLKTSVKKNADRNARRARFEARLESALAAYAAAEAAAPRGSPEAAAAATRAARALVSEHPGFDGGPLAGEDEEGDEEEDEADAKTNTREDGDDEKKTREKKRLALARGSFGYDTVSFRSRESRLRVAVSAARRAAETRRFDPAARLALADLLAASGDAEAAFDEYAEALYHLPYHGETAAAATTRAGAAAAAAAHRLAGFCHTMTQALAETHAADDTDTDTNDDDFFEKKRNAPRVPPERVAEIESGLARAAAMAQARSKEAAMNHLEALVMSPSRRRHASLATATLAHAAIVDARYEDALNAAAIVERCDEKRPPQECHAVFLSHARGLMDMRLWSLAREAAHLAVSARGEKGRETRAAWALAAEAERRMDVVADEALMEKTLGKDWRKILRGDPTEKEEL